MCWAIFDSLIIAVYMIVIVSSFYAKILKYIRSYLSEQKEEEKTLVKV